MAFEKGKPRHPNAGRKKGTPNRRTFDAAALAEEMGVDPLKILLDLCSHRDPGIQLGAAKEAAKYVYTQKRATELSGPNGQPIQTEVEASEQLQELLADLKTIVDTKVNERKG